MTIELPTQPDVKAEPVTVDVRLEHVVKRFGDTVAVDDIVLDLAHGEFFSLLGPSGCGKTTTLSMIGGFEMPTSGIIVISNGQAFVRRGAPRFARSPMMVVHRRPLGGGGARTANPRSFRPSAGLRPR